MSRAAITCKQRSSPPIREAKESLVHFREVLRGHAHGARIGLGTLRTMVCHDEAGLRICICNLPDSRLIHRSELKLPEVEDSDLAAPDDEVLDVHHYPEKIGAIALLALAVEPYARELSACLRPRLVNAASVAGRRFGAPCRVVFPHFRDGPRETTASTWATRSGSR